MNCGVCSEEKDRIWAHQWKAQPYSLVHQEGFPELDLKDIGSGASQCADVADGPPESVPTSFCGLHCKCRLCKRINFTSQVTLHITRFKFGTTNQGHSCVIWKTNRRKRPSPETFGGFLLVSMVREVLGISAIMFQGPSSKFMGFNQQL